jgi:hypothetical protein
MRVLNVGRILSEIRTFFYGVCMYNEQLGLEGILLEFVDSSNSAYRDNRSELQARDQVLGILPFNLRAMYFQIGAMEAGKERNTAVHRFNQLMAEAFPGTSGTVYDIRKDWEVVVAKPYISDD